MPAEFSSSSSGESPPYTGPPVLREALMRHAVKSEAEWAALNPKPARGQILFNDDGRFKVGNDIDFWLTLEYHTHTWDDIADKPLVFPPAGHQHPWADIVDPPATYPPSGHQHVQDDVIDLATTLATKLDAAAYTRGFTVSITGRMTDNEVLATIPILAGYNDFVLAAGGAQIVAKAATAATGSATIAIKKNGAVVATVTWAAAGTLGAATVTTDVAFVDGDLLTVHAPASADVTLADIGITFGGERI